MGSKETDEVAAAGRQPELYPAPLWIILLYVRRGGGGLGGFGTYFFGIDN